MMLNMDIMNWDYPSSTEEAFMPSLSNSGLFDPSGGNYFDHDLFESHLEHISSTFLEPPAKRRKLNNDEEEEEPSTPTSNDETTWNESPSNGVTSRGMIPPLLLPNPSLTSLSSSSTISTTNAAAAIAIANGFGLEEEEEEKGKEEDEDEKRSFSIPSLMSSISPPILKDAISHESNIRSMLMMMNTNNTNCNYDDNDSNENKFKMEIAPASPPPPALPLIASASASQISSPHLYQGQRYKKTRLGYNMNAMLNVDINDEDTCAMPFSSSSSSSPLSLVARQLEPELDAAYMSPHSHPNPLLPPLLHHHPQQDWSVISHIRGNNAFETIGVQNGSDVSIWNEQKQEAFEERKYDGLPPLYHYHSQIQSQSQSQSSQSQSHFDQVENPIPVALEIKTTEEKLRNSISESTTAIEASNENAIKRKRGRPKGSKNKKTKHREEKEMELLLQTKRGRPKGNRSAQKPYKKMQKKEDGNNNNNNNISECLHYQYGNIPDLSLKLSVDKRQPFNHLWWYCAVVGSDDDIAVDEEYKNTFVPTGFNAFNTNTSTVNTHGNTNTHAHTAMDISRISPRFATSAVPAINDMKFSISSNLF